MVIFARKKQIPLEHVGLEQVSPDGWP